MDTSSRYEARPCCGPGKYMIYDTEEGRSYSRQHRSQEDAEREVARLNKEDAKEKVSA
jgi:hypothetical protein